MRIQLTLNVYVRMDISKKGQNVRDASWNVLLAGPYSIASRALQVFSKLKTFVLNAKASAENAYLKPAASDVKIVTF